MADTTRDDPFYWTIEALTIDGFRWNPNQWKDREEEDILGEGLYAILRGNLRARVLPTHTRTSPVESWVVPRAVLLQERPTKADARRWARVSRLNMNCTSCRLTGKPSLTALLADAGPPAARPQVNRPR